MRRIIFLFIIFFTLFFNFDLSYSDCVPPEWDFDVWFQIDDCLTWSKLVSADATIWWGFANTIKKWVSAISIFLWLFSVLGIVYWAFMLTISAWEDEKISKSKWIIKWSIIGFIWIITASFVINLLIKLFYSI